MSKLKFQTKSQIQMTKAIRGETLNPKLERRPKRGGEIRVGEYRDLGDPHARVFDPNLMVLPGRRAGCGEVCSRQVIWPKVL